MFLFTFVYFYDVHSHDDFEMFLMTLYSLLYAFSDVYCDVFIDLGLGVRL